MRLAQSQSIGVDESGEGPTGGDGGGRRTNRAWGLGAEEEEVSERHRCQMLGLMSNAGSRENRQVNLETWRSLGRVTEKSEFAVLGRGRNLDGRGSWRD